MRFCVLEATIFSLGARFAGQNPNVFAKKLTPQLKMRFGGNHFLPEWGGPSVKFQIFPQKGWLHSSKCVLEATALSLRGRFSGQNPIFPEKKLPPNAIFAFGGNRIKFLCEFVCLCVYMQAFWCFRLEPLVGLVAYYIAAGVALTFELSEELAELVRL